MKASMASWGTHARASEKLEHLGSLFLATNSLMHPLANSLVKYEDLSAIQGGNKTSESQGCCTGT